MSSRTMTASIVPPSRCVAIVGRVTRPRLSSSSLNCRVSESALRSSLTLKSPTTNTLSVVTLKPFHFIVCVTYISCLSVDFFILHVFLMHSFSENRPSILQTSRLSCFIFLIFIKSFSQSASCLHSVSRPSQSTVVVYHVVKVW